MSIKSKLVLVFLVLTLTACVKNPVTGKKQLAVMSEAREIGLGASYDPQIVAEFGLYQDSILQNYINVKGKEMAKISHRPELDYKFRVVDSPVVNAFAVPGGYIYFTRGIMAHFNNEAEFTGVLGHEIGHVTARHTAVAQRNSTFAQLGLIAGMVASPQIAQFAEPLSSGMGLLLLKFGRDAESQSDELGVEYSSKIGYDAREMSYFFGTLNRLSGGPEGRVPEFYSTHPDPLNRKEEVSHLASEWQEKLHMTSPKVNRNSYLQMLDGLVYGEDPRQGFVENFTFYHPVLKFQFPVPNDWAYQNSPQQFQMAPKDGKAMMLFTLAQGESLEAAALAFAQQYKIIATSSKNVTLHGNPAYELVGHQTTEAAQGDIPAGTPAVGVKIILISYDRLIYMILGAAEFADMGTYIPQFDGTMKNFKKLTDPDKLGRLPERLGLYTVSHAGTLESILSQKGIPVARHSEWAIVNGMELSETVPTGTIIKVIK
jgi:predicted Zn-dependent protease